MKRTPLPIIVLFVLGLLGDAPLLAQDSTTTDFYAYWKKGLHVDSRDGAFKMNFGGRIHHQWTLLSDHTFPGGIFGNERGGVEFRRLRFYHSGLLYGVVDYKLDMEFSGGGTEVKDAYLTIRHLPVIGNLRTGHFKEPFGLDQLHSSNDMTFIERASSFDLTPGRNNGFLGFNSLFKERLTWALGIYWDADGNGDTELFDAYAFTGRLTVLPFYAEEGRQLLHLGVAYSFRRPPEGNYGFKSRPEAHLAPVLAAVDFSGTAEHVQLFGLELIAQKGAFALQGEYNASYVYAADLFLQRNYTFYAYYLECSYFLTGEHRKYKKSVGFFKRTLPGKNFGRKSPGAWQLAFRYAYTDYTDGLQNGEEMTNYTVALNWYLNPSIRFQLNYGRVLQNAFSGSIFQLKSQVVF